MFQKLKEFLFENHTTRQTIAKNTTWLLGGQIFGRLIRATIVIYAARVLGAASWGAFSYALGVAAFLTVFTDIGVNALITRETARDKGLEKAYIGTALLVKIILIIAVVFITIVILPYLTNIPEAKKLMPLLLIVFIADTLRDLGGAISRAIEHMQIEASIGIFTNAAIALLGFIFLYYQGTSYALALAYTIGSVLGLLLMAYQLRAHLAEVHNYINVALVGKILKTAWPFGLLGIMGAAMLNTDIIIIGWLRSATEVGYYAAAQKLILLAYVIPGVFSTSIFPVTSRLVMQNRDDAKRIIEKSTALMMLVAAALTIGGALLAKPIIAIVFGATYMPSLATFELLLITLLIVFPSTIIGNAIFAYNEEKNLVPFVILSIGTNVILDIILIPQYGIEGSAVATIMTQLTANAWLYYKIKKVSNMEILPQLKNYLSIAWRIIAFKKS